MKKLLYYLAIPMLSTPVVTQLLANGGYNTINYSLTKIPDKTAIPDYKNGKLVARAENRSFSHSEFSPTGYFLNANVSYQVFLEDFPSESYTIVVGQWGSYKSLNGNKKDCFEEFSFTSQEVDIKPKISGMLYVKNNNSKIQVAGVAGSNLIKVPTFRINYDQDSFITKIKYTDSPFVEFISEHVFGTFQTEMLRKEVLPLITANKINFTDILKHWDNVWNWTNEIYGLNENLDGNNFKHNQLIHIANPDTGYGYAYANNYYIGFQKDTNAGRDLFTKKITDQWGLWHEIGHTYQTPQYMWDGLIEVTVNISSLYVQEKLGVSSRAFDVETIAQIKEFMRQPIEKRDFNSQDNVWLKLEMFWQLKLAFGEQFYIQLNQQYRGLFTREKLAVNENKIQNFIIKSSEVSGYNLKPFFLEWGIKASNQTENLIAKFKPLTQDIWKNFTNSTEKKPIVQEILKPKSLTNFNNKVTPKVTKLQYGDDINKPETLVKLFNIEKALKNCSIDTNYINIFFDDLSKSYKVTVELKISELNMINNIKSFTFDLDVSDTLQFQGLADEIKGYLGLEKSNKLIKFYGNNDMIHYYYQNKLYYEIKVLDAANNLLLDLKVNGEKSFAQVIKENNLENGIKYNENYKIILSLDEPGRTKFFKDDKYQSLSKTKTEFNIISDKLIQK